MGRAGRRSPANAARCDRVRFPSPAATQGARALMTTAPIVSLDAAAVRAEPVVDVAGVAVRLSAPDHTRAAAIAAMFRQARPASSAAQLAVRFTADAIEVPSVAPTTTPGGLQLWRPGGDQLVLRSPSGLTARASADEIQVGGTVPALAREFRYLAVFALTHALAQHGRHLLHAAAVVCDERALLVLGDSGAG